MFAFSKLAGNRGPRKYIQGFSLIELMFAAIITALLSVVAVPGMASWIDSTRAKSVGRQLYSLTSVARSLALNESQTVTICHLDGKKCQLDIALPLSLFIDVNRNAELDADERVVQVLDIKLPNRIKLLWNRSGYMRFWPSGGTGALTGSLSYCDNNNSDNDFRLVVARTGRVRIDKLETRCT